MTNEQVNETIARNMEAKPYDFTEPEEITYARHLIGVPVLSPGGAWKVVHDAEDPTKRKWVAQDFTGDIALAFVAQAALGRPYSGEFARRVINEFRSHGSAGLVYEVLVLGPEPRCRLLLRAMGYDV